MKAQVYCKKLNFDIILNHKTAYEKFAEIKRKS